MNIFDLRNFFIEAVTDAVDETVEVYDLAPGKADAAKSRVRVTVMPRETSNLTLGINNLKEGAGVVQCDVIGPCSAGIENVEGIAQDIISSVETKTYTTPNGQLIVYAVWADALNEETPYLRVPVFIRWSLIHK